MLDSTPNGHQENQPSFTISPSVQDAVSQCYKQANGNAQEAARLLLLAAQANSRLKEAILNPHLMTHCWQLICQHSRNERARICAPLYQEDATKIDLAGKGERLAHLAAANARTLFDFPLPLEGLPKLGDASKDQVLASAEFYVKQANDMTTKSRWLNLIAKASKQGKAIREQFTLIQLENLFQKARVLQ